MRMRRETHTLSLAARQERTFAFKFPACDKLPPPVLPFIDVSFGYDGNPEGYLYKVCAWVWGCGRVCAEGGGR